MASESPHCEDIATADVVDVVHRFSTGASRVFLFLLLAPFLIVVGIVIAGLLQMGAVSSVATMIAIPTGGIVYVLISQDRKAKARAAEWMKTSGDSITPESVTTLLDVTEALSPTAAVDALPGLLAAKGYWGRAIRIAPLKYLEPIRPLGIFFEPVALQEEDSVFQELAASGESDFWKPANSEARGGRGRRALSRVNDAIQKRHRGWYPFVVLLGLVALHAVGSIQAGRATRSLMIFLFLFILTLVGKLREDIAGEQWLAVPGGLLVRSPSRGGRWKLKLFTRQSSTVCCYRNSAQQWNLRVCDGDAEMSKSGTQAEIHFALRAWFSPLPPPAFERLSDWA